MPLSTAGGKERVMTIKEEIQIEEYKRTFAEAYKQGFIDAMSVMKRHECSTGRCPYTQTEREGE